MRVQALDHKKISGAVRETAPDEFVNCALALMADTLLDARKFPRVSAVRHR
jgi:hypothetical protein